jgi:hypothetical protein
MTDSLDSSFKDMGNKFITEQSMSNLNHCSRESAAFGRSEMSLRELQESVAQEYH